MSVYANGREISGKATPNKTIAAFPDVCLSPPSPPAGPIPIPYPLTGMASDTTDGTSSVFIKGKEAGKKNGVKYSKVTGNEPATNSFGANIVSHKITGPLKFAAYSFDVMIEKGGAERFMDLTTQNHMNSDGKSVGVDTAGVAGGGPPPDPECAALKDKNDKFRKKHGNKVIGESDGAPKTFDDSGTVSHGLFKPAGGGASPTAPGVSATAQLQAAKVNGLCAPTSRVYERTPYEHINTKTGEVTERWAPASYRMNFCPGNECIHPAGGLQAHAELNVLNNLPQPTTKKDSILLAIDWNSSKGKGNPNPCGNCQKTIACACQCLTIVICDKDGQPIDRCETPYEPEV